MSSVKAGEVICAARGETTYLLFVQRGDRGLFSRGKTKRERERNHKNIP